MVFCAKVEDFHNKNDKDVRRIVSYIIRSRDRDLIEEYTQSLYLHLLTKDVLSKFSHIDKPEEERNRVFSSWMYRIIKNRIFLVMRDEIKHGDLNKVREVKVNDNMVPVFEALSISGNPVSQKAMGLMLDPLFTDSYVHGTLEEDTLTLVEEFREKFVGEEEDLSDRTRQLCIDYLTRSASGEASWEIAESNQVSGAYISIIRGSLRKKFEQFREERQAAKTLLGVMVG